jgi:catalase
MKKLTTAFGAPVDDNQNIATAGKRGPALLQNVWLVEKMAHFDREVSRAHRGKTDRLSNLHAVPTR